MSVIIPNQLLLSNELEKASSRSTWAEMYFCLQVNVIVGSIDHVPENTKCSVNRGTN